MGGAKFRVTDEQRRTVRRLAQLSLDWPRIAHVLDIGEKTARKYFNREFERGRSESGTMILASLHKAATRHERPSVEAAKLLLDRLGLGPPAPLGKKERAQLDALNADDGTGWAGLLN
jgi:hypothetical protein